MKKLSPKPLPRVKTIAIITGMATALISGAFAAPSPTPTPTPSAKRGVKAPPAPPNTTPYSG